MPEAFFAHKNKMCRNASDFDQMLSSESGIARKIMAFAALPSTLFQKKKGWKSVHDRKNDNKTFQKSVTRLFKVNNNIFKEEDI